MEKVTPIIEDDKLICPKCNMAFVKNISECYGCGTPFYSIPKLKEKKDDSAKEYGECYFCDNELTWNDIEDNNGRLSSDRESICRNCSINFRTSYSKNYLEISTIVEEGTIEQFNSDFIKSIIVKIDVCPKCESKINDKNNRYCDQCGYELNPPEIIIGMVCKKCGETYPETKKYCSQDGAKLTKQETEKSQQPNKLITSKNDKMESQIQKPKIDSQNKNSENDKELGFFWGNVWIVLATITGLILFIGGLDILLESNNGAFFGLSFPFFISAYGIYKKKIYLGLYFTFGVFLMNLLINLGMLLSMSKNIPAFLLLFLIHILWGVYFYNRRKIFIN